MANEKRLIYMEDAIALFEQDIEENKVALRTAYHGDKEAIKSEMAGMRMAIALVKSLARNGFTVDAVEVPCKVGDLVWGIKRWNRGQKAIQSVVTQMYFGDNMRLGIVVKGVCHGEWGKNVFATEEEALAKIDGERKDNE